MPTLKIYDRSLIGPSLENRTRGWQLSTNSLRGHPMVSQRGGQTIDYLRRSSARYYSWAKGYKPSEYEDFKYLNDSLVEGQASVDDAIGFNFAELNTGSFTELPLASAIAPLRNLVYRTIGGSGSSGNSPAKEQLSTIILSGSNNEWESSSTGSGVSPDFTTLFNEPTWTNWQAYVLGGSAVNIDDDDTPQRQFPGLFGSSANNYYYDHQFEKDLPEPEEVAVTTNYNYYNSFFDEMINNSGISELHIPNLYDIYSIAHNGLDYLYPMLFGDTGGTNNGSYRASITNLISKSIGEIIDNDNIANNQVSLGQIGVSYQTPDSILSRFARKDFSQTASLDIVKQKNKHIGISPQLLQTSNSFLDDMSGRQGSYPYSISVDFPLSGLTNILPDPATDSPEKFFLYEIMKANILDFNSGSYNYYEHADFLSVETNGDKFKYRGFDWTGSGSWVPQDNPEARQPFKVNTIDLTELLINILDNNSSEHGFSNQTVQEDNSLIDGIGHIVGQEYYSDDTPGNDPDDYNLYNDDLQDFLIQLGRELIDNTRTYSEMLNNEKCYNRTLVYKLDKHLVDTSTNQPSPEPIQSIYFPNNVEGNITYCDTQVKFGQRYMYKAYSYDLVVGNKYKYSSPQVFPPLATRYPSLLGRLMGFNPGTSLYPKDIEVGLAHGFRKFPGKQIYVGNPIEYSTVPPTSNQPFSILSSPGLSWFDIDSPFYLDYKIGTDQTIYKVELDVLGHGPSTAKQANLLQVATQVQDALPSQWRVRFVVDQVASADGKQQGRFVMGKISDLQGLSSLEAYDLMSGLGVPAYSTHTSIVSTIFDLPTLNFSPINSSNITFLFETGPHGSAPEYPWDLSRIGEAEVDVDNFRSVKILELPYFETKVFEVADLPPQYPDVNILPIKGENNKIKILLSENATKNAYSPISIEPEDEAKFEDIRISQGRDPGEPLVFGSDDTILSFQIYRTTTPPASYTDFSGLRTDTLSTTTTSGRSITTASKLDLIQPNVAYYYCFRTIDKNGYISIPSPVLKVQIVDDNGRMFSIIEPHNLSFSETGQSEKSFKRYLEIDTSLEAKRINGILPDATTAGNPLNAPTDVSLSGSVWDTNTTFKVRVTSKDTGRKVDLNLNFNVDTIPNPNLQGD